MGKKLRKKNTVEKIPTHKRKTKLLRKKITVEKIPTHNRKTKEEILKEHPTEVVFPKEFDVLSEK